MRTRNLPTIDAGYWAAIVAASICGTNTGDLAAGPLGLGHVRGIVPLGAIFLAVIWAEKMLDWMTVALLGGNHRPAYDGDQHRRLRHSRPKALVPRIRPAPDCDHGRDDLGGQIPDRYDGATGGGVECTLTDHRLELLGLDAGRRRARHSA